MTTRSQKRRGERRRSKNRKPYRVKLNSLSEYPKGVVRECGGKVKERKGDEEGGKVERFNSILPLFKVLCSVLVDLVGGRRKSMDCARGRSLIQDPSETFDLLSDCLSLSLSSFLRCFGFFGFLASLDDAVEQVPDLFRKRRAKRECGGKGASDKKRCPLLMRSSFP